MRIAHNMDTSFDGQSNNLEFRGSQLQNAEWSNAQLVRDKINENLKIPDSPHQKPEQPLIAIYSSYQLKLIIPFKN